MKKLFLILIISCSFAIPVYAASVRVSGVFSSGLEFQSVQDACTTLVNGSIHNITYTGSGALVKESGGYYFSCPYSERATGRTDVVKYSAYCIGGTISVSPFGCYEEKEEPANTCPVSGTPVAGLGGSTIFNSPARTVCYEGCVIAGSFATCFTEDGKTYCDIDGPFAHLGRTCTTDTESEGGGGGDAGDEEGTNGECPSGTHKESFENKSYCVPDNNNSDQCPEGTKQIGTVNGKPYCSGGDSSGSGSGSGSEGSGEGSGGGTGGGTGEGSGEGSGSGSGGNGDGSGSGSGGGTGGGGGGSGQGEGEGEGNGTSWGGTCSDGFKCEGDALICAISEAEYKRNCNLLDDAKDSVEAQIYEDAKQSDQYNNNAHGAGVSNLPRRNINVTDAIDTSSLFGSGSAPSDMHFTVLGVQHTLPLSMATDLFFWIGAVLRLLSFLIALQLAFGG